MDGLAILEAFSLLRQTFPSPLGLELGSIRDAAEAITETGPARFALRLQLCEEAFQERSAEHTSELQSLMRESDAVSCFQIKTMSTGYRHYRTAETNPEG